MIMDFLSIVVVWGAACLFSFICGVVLLKSMFIPLFFEFPAKIPGFFRKEIGFFRLVEPIFKFSLWFMALFAFVFLILTYLESLTYFIAFNILTLSIPLKFGLIGAVIWSFGSILFTNFKKLLY